MFKLETGQQAVIALFLLVMFGGLLAGSQIQEPGITPMLILGFGLMIAGNLGIWGMIREQNRIARRKTIKQ